MRLCVHSGLLQFMRDSGTLVAAELDAVTLVELRGNARRRIAVPGVQALAAFADQVWVATRGGALVRFSSDARRLDEHALPNDPDGSLITRLPAAADAAARELDAAKRESRESGASGPSPDRSGDEPPAGAGEPGACPRMAEFAPADLSSSTLLSSVVVHALEPGSIRERLHEVAALVGNAGLAADYLAAPRDALAEHEAALADPQHRASSTPIPELIDEFGLSPAVIDVLLVIAAPSLHGDVARELDAMELAPGALLSAIEALAHVARPAWIPSLSCPGAPDALALPSEMNVCLRIVSTLKALARPPNRRD